MNKIFLTLSLLLAAGCAKVDQFPNLPFYVVDVANQTCVKYQLTDRKAIKFKWLSEAPLVAKGPCDRAIGFSAKDFNTAKNWIRDQIKQSESSVNLEGK